jgi:hypothetical protein
MDWKSNSEDDDEEDGDTWTSIQQKQEDDSDDDEEDIVPAAQERASPARPAAPTNKRRGGLSAENQIVLLKEWNKVQDLPRPLRLKAIKRRNLFSCNNPVTNRQVAQLITRWNADYSLFVRTARRFGITIDPPADEVATTRVLTPPPVVSFGTPPPHTPPRTPSRTPPRTPPRPRQEAIMSASASSPSVSQEDYPDAALIHVDLVRPENNREALILSVDNVEEEGKVHTMVLVAMPAFAGDISRNLISARIVENNYGLLIDWPSVPWWYLNQFGDFLEELKKEGDYHKLMKQEHKVFKAGVEPPERKSLFL